LKDIVDKNAKFVGLDTIKDAIDYMYSGKNIGKVVVQVGLSDYSIDSTKSSML